MDDPDEIGDWIKERVLGCGGFGVVTLWKNSKNYERIAIKKYRGEIDNLTLKQKDRWTQEVEMMKKINNDNIVSFRILPKNLDDTLTDYKYNQSNLPLLSMEYCTQGDLRSVLTRSENCCGLPESDVRYILKDLMNAVSYLHTLKITHRDLKPENIVLQLSDRPNGIIYKLIDLGYAKELDAKSICASFVGTLQYLAPEFLYSKTYSCSVDYWSMGLVAFEVICGIRPFLPNKSPAQWMFHVHKKTSDIISILQLNESEESITSFKEIFKECHISSNFKTYMEAWLQLALEYNPRKRGYQNYDPDNCQNELVFFTSLQSLLNKKIISVFIVNISEFFSYEIDDCTCVETVQGWIERDTKIKTNEQILLSYKCDNIDLDGLAIQMFDETYINPMVYVYKKSVFLSMEIKPKHIPELVEKMLNNSLENLQYYFQKRSYAHALYFIFNENNIYNTILDACSLRIKHLLKNCEEISYLSRNVSLKIEKLTSQRDFSQSILDFDYAQYVKHYNQCADHWLESFKGISAKIDTLYGICSHISVRYESVHRRSSILSVKFNNEYSKHNDHDLNKLLDEGIKCYNLVRSKTKEKRNKPENCKNMTRIVYNVLKFRDMLLRDENFRKYLQVMTDIDLELDKMSASLRSSMEIIQKYEKELNSDHLNRQSKIWSYTIKQKPKTKNPDTGTTLKPNFEDYATPFCLEKPLNFILEDPFKNNSSLESNSSYHSAEIQNSLEIKKAGGSDINNGQSVGYDQKQVQSKTITIRMPNFATIEPFSEVVNHNKSLRHELQEKTNESYMNYKSILNEEFDFSFLNE